MPRSSASASGHFLSRANGARACRRVSPANYGLKTTFYNTTRARSTSTRLADGVGCPREPGPRPAALAAHSPRDTPGDHFGASSEVREAPYFTNPTSCAGDRLQAEFKVTSWQHPAKAKAHPRHRWASARWSGCDALLMEPSLTAEVTSSARTRRPALTSPRRSRRRMTTPRGLATSTLKKEVVTLPEGMTVNPSSGAGLAACSEAQYAEERAPEKTAQEKEAGNGCPNSRSSRRSRSPRRR